MGREQLRRIAGALAGLPRRRRRLRLAYAVASAAVYVAASAIFRIVFGDDYAALAILPVAFIAWLFGMWAGIAAAMLFVPVNALLYTITAYNPGVASVLAPNVAALGVAAAVGALRDLGLQVRASREQLGTVIANAPLLLFAVDAEGTLTFEDGKALTRLGVTRGQNVGKSFFELYREQPEAVAMMRRALAGEDVSRQFGTGQLEFDVHYSPIRDGGHILGAIGVALDVSQRVQAESEARESQERFRRFFELAPVGSLIMHAGDGRIVDCNVSFLVDFGYARSEVIGRTTTELGLWTDEQREAVLAHSPKAPAMRNFEVRSRTKLGEERTLLVSWDTVDLGGERYVVATSTDITERLRAEEALRRSEQRFAQLFRENPAGLLVSRLSDGRVLDANPAWLRMTGFQRQEIVGRTVFEVDLWVDRGAERALMQRLQEEGRVRDFEFRFRVRAGDAREALASFELVDFSGERCVLTSAIDITDRKRAENALEHRALHDDLTGLPNRVLLHDRLEQGIRLARRQSGSLALVVMDLDHFKEVNDTFGHHAGDELLRQVGPRLRDQLRESDTVARLGGDEFALILPGAGAGAAKRVAQTVLQALGESYVVESQQLHVTASMGIVVFPQHGEDADTLLRRADIAMYVAKRSGSSFVEYTAEEDAHTPARLAILGELGEGIERDELVVHFHPEVSLRSGKVVGMEALVRWQHPERGLIAPDEFVPLAERTHLIRGLTLAVLRRAIAACRSWQATSPGLRVAVNLSPRNLADPELPDVVGRILEENQLASHLLSLEITETVLMNDPRRAMETLARLRRMGVRLAVDDFGTGYSSLGYLHELAVHQVKIDKSFVRGMKVDRGSSAIVRATVELGHNLGCEVVAEGVEDEETAQLLAGMGTDLAQGYHISLPMDGPAVLPWLDAYALAPRILPRVTA